MILSFMIVALQLKLKLLRHLVYTLDILLLNFIHRKWINFYWLEINQLHFDHFSKLVLGIRQLWQHKFLAICENYAGIFEIFVPVIAWVAVKFGINTKFHCYSHANTILNDCTLLSIQQCYYALPIANSTNKICCYVLNTCHH